MILAGGVCKGLLGICISLGERGQRHSHAQVTAESQRLLWLQGVDSQTAGNWAVMLALSSQLSALSAQPECDNLQAFAESCGIEVISFRSVEGFLAEDNTFWL